MHIGVAGLGRMGSAIAARLVEVGHTVSGWNRSADKAKALGNAGVVLVDTPAALAARAEIIITILTDAAAIDAVYGGPSGLLSGAVDGKLFIEMSTVRPETEIALAAKLSDQPLLFDLARLIGERMEAEAEAWVSSDQDVQLKLSHVRKGRSLLPAEGPADIQSPWFVPLGVLYDRQTFSAAWPAGAVCD